MCRSSDTSRMIDRQTGCGRIALSCLLLILAACSTTQDRADRLTARPADTLRAMNADRAASPNPSCRKLLRSAQRSFPMRQHALVQRYLVDLRDNELDFSRRTAKGSVRRVAAGLSALREEQRHAAAFPDGPTLYQPS